MLKNKKIISIILIILVFLGIGFLNFKSISKPILILNYTNTFSDSLSVYNFMEKLRNEGKINFTEKDYTGMGKFITSINGTWGNTEKNWIYYVNDKKMSIGVSSYELKQGDVVSWKYE